MRALNTALSRRDSCRPTDQMYTRHTSRLIGRDGKVQIRLDKLSLGKKKRYWHNLLTTLLDLKWRYVMIIFAVGFIFTWFVFAVVYYSIASNHGDLGQDYPNDFVPCMNGVYSFTTAFLFSLETQHTIGYGSRNPTTECSEAIFAVFLQFMIGVAVQCVTAGLVVAKLQMGKRTPKAILFSDRACVGVCEGEVCLMVRVGNAGSSQMVTSRGYGILIERHQQDDNEETFTESVLNFMSENGSKNVNLLWPAVMHCMITENQKDFIRKLQRPGNELVIILEGVLLSTGQNLQLRSSYLPHEIDIGKQFLDISPRLETQDGGNRYHHVIDYSDFNVIQPDENWIYDLWSHKSAN